MDIKDTGLDWYVSESEGINGDIRRNPEDFRVIEESDFSYKDKKGGYSVLKVTLKNYETHRFAQDLSQKLGISRKRVAWAGNKDKKALTTQLFTVRGISKEEISKINIKNSKIEFLGYSDHPISLGSLKANRFIVRVRNILPIKNKKQRIEKITDEIKEFGGFPNLFGEQRFGSKRPVSHIVGKKLLKGDYKGAVFEYLCRSFQEESDRTRKARERLKRSQDYREALDYFPKYLKYERSILHGLSQGFSYKEAIEKLPFRLRLLLVNAVQSRIFNLILKERKSRDLRFDRAYDGDIVCFVSSSFRGNPIPDTDRLQKVKKSNKKIVNKHIERDKAFVTAPLLGSKSDFSGGLQGEIERKILEETELNRKHFEDTEYKMEGSRRPILFKTDVSFDVKDYVEFKFSLPKGSYATVVLREYLKRK